jgi:hypothetical protein
MTGAILQFTQTFIFSLEDDEEFICYLVSDEYTANRNFYIDNNISFNNCITVLDNE